MFWCQLLLRSAALLLTAEALHKWSKRTSAAFRYRLLLLAFLLLALFPILAGGLPEIAVNFRSESSPNESVTVEQTWHASTSTSSLQRVNWLLFVWLTGALAAITPTITGMLALRRLLRRAEPVRDACWPILLDEALQNMPCRRPHILISDEIVVPVTAGITKALIILPATWANWSASRRRAVLLHELAHVRRWDVGAQLCVSVIAALWWFQPLVWKLRGQLRAESEFACDASALAAGFLPSGYAAELLAVAHGIGARADQLPVTGISMVRGDLEGRLRFVLGPPLLPLSRVRAWIAFLTLASAALGASTITARSEPGSDEQGGSPMKHSLLSGLLASAGLSAATITGSIYDPSGAAIPDAKILLYNPDNGVKQEATSGSDGRFTLEGAPAGEYIMRVQKPGFSSLFREFNLKEDSKIDRGLTMNLGKVIEQLQVEGKGVNSGASPTSGPSPDSSSRPIRVGGKVSAANIISKKAPVYPESAKIARLQGAVEVECVISKEGVPLETRVISSPSDDLSEATLEAVRQWRYKPTLLNGEPVEVVTNITVNFTLSE
jgi:TonB family protein